MMSIWHELVHRINGPKRELTPTSEVPVNVSSLRIIIAIVNSKIKDPPYSCFEWNILYYSGKSGFPAIYFINPRKHECQLLTILAGSKRLGAKHTYRPHASTQHLLAGKDTRYWANVYCLWIHSWPLEKQSALLKNCSTSRHQRRLQRLQY